MAAAVCFSSFSSRSGRRAVPRAVPSLCRCSQCWPKAAHQRFPPSGVNGHHPYCLFTRVITAGLLAPRRSGIEGVHLHNCVASQIIGSGEDQEQKSEEPQRPKSHIGFRHYRYRTRRTIRLEIDGPRRVGAEPGVRMAPASPAAHSRRAPLASSQRQPPPRPGTHIGRPEATFLTTLQTPGKAPPHVAASRLRPLWIQSPNASSRCRSPVAPWPRSGPQITRAILIHG